MDEQIKQISKRILGLRESLALEPEDIARDCNIELADYLKIESGEVDIPVGILHRISKVYGVELNALMFDDEPNMNSYFVTRKGKGVTVERRKAYKYQSLASSFIGRNADPFLVTVYPNLNNETFQLNTHSGQEYSYVVSGRLFMKIGGKEFELEAGDSIYFNAELPHGMKALDDEKACFLTIII